MTVVAHLFIDPIGRRYFYRLETRAVRYSGKIPYDHPKQATHTAFDLADRLGLRIVNGKRPGESYRPGTAEPLPPAQVLGSDLAGDALAS